LIVTSGGPAPIDQDDDVSYELADLLGTTTEAMADEIGAGWRRAPLTSDKQLYPWDDRPRRAWFVSGQPLQVMIGVGHGDVWVAEPDVQWHDHRPVLAPAPTLATHALATIGTGGPLRDAVQRAEQQRRATFGYCRYCRELTAPEHQFADDVCQGCSSRFLGVVF
jgi:hypothetical protein